MNLRRPKIPGNWWVVIYHKNDKKTYYAFINFEEKIFLLEEVCTLTEE